MELADKLRVDATSGPRKWHRHDRLLAQLDPRQVQRIEEFYENSGPSLSELMDKEALKSYDLECLSRLMAWLEPEVAEQVVESCA